MHNNAPPGKVKPKSPRLSKSKQTELMVEGLMPLAKRFFLSLHPGFECLASGYWENQEEGWRVKPDGNVYDLSQEGSPWIGNLITLWIVFRHPKWLDDRNYCRSHKRLIEAYREILQWRIAEEGKPEPLFPWEAKELAVNEVRAFAYYGLGLDRQSFVRGSVLALLRTIEKNVIRVQSAEAWKALKSDYPVFASTAALRDRLDRWAEYCACLYEKGKRRRNKSKRRISFNEDGIVDRYAFRVRKLPWQKGTLYELRRVKVEAKLANLFPGEAERLERWQKEAREAGLIEDEGFGEEAA
jgi:hypothetical protein